MTWPGTIDMAAPQVIQPRRTLQGRRFAPVAEAELHPVLLRLAGTFRSAELLIAIPEFYGVYGIVDLAVVSAGREQLQSRLHAPVPPLTYALDALLISALSTSRPQSIARLARRTQVDERTVEERVRRYLSKMGAVTRTRSGALLRHPALVPVGRVHALEAKVSDWRRAGHQAQRYSLWADSASIVLGRAPRNVQPLTERLSADGIGIAVAGRWLRRPAARRHGRARRLLVSEMVVAAIGEHPLSYQPSSVACCSSPSQRGAIQSSASASIRGNSAATTPNSRVATS